MKSAPSPLHHAGETPPGEEVAITLPEQDLCRQVLQQRYLQPGERHREDLFLRVAHALAQAEEAPMRALWSQRFRQTLADGGLLDGRILAGVGTGLHTTLVHGFVQAVGDCTLGHDEAGHPGIYEALGQTAETLRRGGDVGCDFSALRPRGALVRSTASLASGPCSYIDVFEQSCATVEAASMRRGAQMALLRIDHPDIQEFIQARHSRERWRHFKLAVAVSDAFMQALQNDADWPLVHRASPGQAQMDQGAHWREDGLWVYRTVPARALWETLLQAAHDSAEPGVLFTDTVHRDNNLRQLEQITAATPCGQQPLPAYGASVLGAVLLPRFVRQPFTPQACIDWEALGQCARVLVRMLDNVLELSWWPVPEQHREAHTKRRIGLGFTGLADTLNMLGLRYDSEEGRVMAARIAQSLRDAAYASSLALAREKAPYPLFSADLCLAEGTFASRLPQALQAEIRQHGLRNSHLLCIAPLRAPDMALADNTSSGLEPPMGWAVRHTLPQLHAHASLVENHALRVFKALGGDASHLPPSFVTASQITAQDQIAMLAAVQPFVDAGISPILNLADKLPLPSLDALFTQAWRRGLKGLGCRRPEATSGHPIEAVAP